MSGPVLGKKGDPTLLAAVRRVRDNGMTWQQFIEATAPEFGAVFRDGAIDGWKPVAKGKRR